MMKALFCMPTILIMAISNSALAWEDGAFDGYGYFKYVSKKGDTDKTDGIWQFNFKTGEKKQVWGKSDGTSWVNGNELLSLSPDGKRIAFVNSKGMLCIMNNDGTDYKEYVNAQPEYRTRTLIWNQKGIWWAKNQALMRFDPATQDCTVVITPNWEKGTSLYSSVDGTRWFAYAGHVFDLTADLKQQNDRPFTDWLHGKGMTLNGDFLIGVRDKHENVWHIDFKTLKYVNYRLPLTAGYKLHTDLIQCTNDDDVLGISILGNEWTDLNKSSEVGIYHWKENKIVKVKKPLDWWLPSKFNFVGLWKGALPSPHGTNPSLAIDKSELVFAVPQGQNSPSQTVTITNQGAGTLAKVTTAVTPSAPWLTTSISGSGNTQTITNSIDASKAPDGVTEVTVTVSESNAPNTVSYTVTVNKNVALVAPSQLKATPVGDSLLDVKLTWQDNSDNEDGFVIERKDGSGEWKKVVEPKANAAEYTDLQLAMGDYVYRIRAVKSDLSSQYSAETKIALMGIMWIRVTSPTSDTKIAASQAIAITWEENQVPTIAIDYSDNDGLTWTTITKLGGITLGDPDWKNYQWTVPNELANKTILIKVYEYDKRAEGVSQPVAIVGMLDAHSLNTPMRKGFHITVNNGMLQVSNRASMGICTVALMTAGGRSVIRHGMVAVNQTLSLKNIPSGMYLLIIKADDAFTRFVRPVTIQF
jgi:hypothetical protein